MSTVKDSEINLQELLGMIAFKYGEVVNYDFSALWNSRKEKDYLQFLKAESINNSNRSKQKYFLKGNVFYSTNFQIKKTKTCSVCPTMIYRLEDTKYHNKYGTCFHCYLRYIENDKDRWNKGWRPNKNG